MAEQNDSKQKTNDVQSTNGAQATFDCEWMPEITFSFPIYEGYRLLPLKPVQKEIGGTDCIIEFVHTVGFGENPIFTVSHQKPPVPIFKSLVNPFYLAYIVVGDETKMSVFFWGDGLESRGISIEADYPSRHNFEKSKFFDLVIQTMKVKK